jgi:hypothetical protein
LYEEGIAALGSAANAERSPQRRRSTWRKEVDDAADAAIKAAKRTPADDIKDRSREWFRLDKRIPEHIGPRRARTAWMAFLKEERALTILRRDTFEMGRGRGERTAGRNVQVDTRTKNEKEDLLQRSPKSRGMDGGEAGGKRREDRTRRINKRSRGALGRPFLFLM